MDRREWLRREIGAWRDEGIVTEETAETLCRGGVRVAQVQGRLAKMV